MTAETTRRQRKKHFGETERREGFVMLQTPLFLIVKSDIMKRSKRKRQEDKMLRNIDNFDTNRL